MKFTQPIKIVFKGNKAVCHEYIRFAAKQLNILERQMSFQGLNEGVRRVSPVYGVFVECISTSYSLREVRIAVEAPTYKQPLPSVDKKEGEKEYKRDLYEDSVVYFIRIRHSGDTPAGYPSSLSSLEFLKQDRIIVWQFEFNAALAETVDPANTANRSNGFVPGGGEVILDVDVVNEIVYYPKNITTEQDIAVYVDKAKKYLTGQPDSNIPGAPLNDKADDWFVRGHLDDPVRQAISCNEDSAPDNEFTYFVGDFYDDPLSSKEYTLIVDEPYIHPYNVVHIYGSDQVNCDDPLSIYNNHQWPKIGVNSIYYQLSSPGYSNDPREVGGPFELHCPSTYWEDGGDSVYTFWSTFQTSVKEDAQVPVNGQWFTALGEYEFSSFFIIDCVDRPGTSGLVYTTNSPGYTSCPLQGEYVSMDLEAWGTGCVVTPLETVEKDEFIVDNDSTTCSEFGSCGSFNMMYADSNTNFEGYGEHLPCLPSNGSVGFRIMYSMPVLWDEDRKYSLNIYEPPKDPNPMIKNPNMTSLLYFYERRDARYSHYGGEYFWYDYNYSGICNGKSVASDPLNGMTKERSTGCIIYAFSPEKFSWQNELGETQYWDIHSARRSQDIINPYRLLVLEEYFNDVVVQLQQYLDENEETAKMYDPDGQFYMGEDKSFCLKYYGYIISDGFARGGKRYAGSTDKPY